MNAQKIILSGTEFLEYDRGRFESGLSKNGSLVAYTEGDKVYLVNKAYKEAVEEWRKYYDISLLVVL